MVVVLVVLTVLLTAAMAASAVRKARRAEPSEQLRRRLSIGSRTWRGIGVLEVCAAAGLPAGLADGRAGVAAAGGTALLMLGAVLAHLRVRITGAALAPPAVLLGVAGAVTMLHAAAL